MLIGIDGNEANIGKRVGVNVYAHELLKAIHKLQGEWKNKYRFLVYLKNIPLSDMPKESENFKYKVLPAKGVWILTKFTPYILLNPDKIDVFFSPSHYLPPISRVPMVCSIMDLGYLRFSEQFRKYDYWQLKYWTAISINISKRIIAISDSTRKDIVRQYPFASKKTVVVPLGYDKTHFSTKISNEDVRRVKAKYHIVNNYILFLSTLKPSKNVEGLLEAFSVISKRFSEFRLVIAGKKGWLYDSIFKKVKSLGLEKDVIFTDFVAEEDKPALIKGAKVFVLPSFWEGFGLDVLNAIACGVPAVVSNIASLPEVVGSAGILVDPYKPESIASELNKVLLMAKKDYNILVEAGLSQANKFTWESTARGILRVLESVSSKI